MWSHWTVRTCHPHAPFEDFEFAHWFWFKLMDLFPTAIAAVAMPNHIHLILPQGVPQAFEKLTGTLGASSRRLGRAQLWQPLCEPTTIPDRHHLRRQVRYLALNPCRKGLCADPLEWCWSTYRETVGAAVGREYLLSNLKNALSDSAKDFQIRFHSYVSGDPSVRVSGTPFPQATRPKDLPQESIHQVLLACASAVRLSPSSVRRPGPLRELFVHSAYRHGWGQPRVLAKICGIQPNSVHWILRKGQPSGLKTVDLCLGDRRLTESCPQLLRAIGVRGVRG